MPKRWDLVKLIYRRGLVTKTVFAVALSCLVILLIIIMAGMADVIRHLSPQQLESARSRLSILTSPNHLMLGILISGLLWIVLYQLTSQIVVYAFFARKPMKLLLAVIVRLLAALPTLVLGNAVFLVGNRLGWLPRSQLATLCFILAALTIISLPTALQVLLEVVGDYDRRQLVQAMALGLNKLVIGKFILLKAIRKTRRLAVLLAMGRTLIEGYLVLDRGLSVTLRSSVSISSSSDLMDVFQGLYSAITIKDNIVMIVILLVFGIFFSLWSSGIGVSRP
jgi:ABC-type sulfate transport system permease component